MERHFPFNEAIYEQLVQRVGSLSYIFSESKRPLIDSRAAEEIFKLSSNGKSIARSDAAYDILTGVDHKIGVGVKTFTIGNSSTYSIEKVQEFTKVAGKGELDLNAEQLVAKIIEERNNKIRIARTQYELLDSGHIYHCLVRIDNGAFIHEEPYVEIRGSTVTPLDASGNSLDHFIESTATVRFSDGVNTYKFSKAKNVLYKKFLIGNLFEKKIIDINIDTAIWGKFTGELPIEAASVLQDFPTDDEVSVPGEDYVILPLYSTRTGKVEKASGINQWNAGGRERKYGESYIPIPSDIHRVAPSFFPPKDHSFELFLPNSNVPVQAKVCQDGGKALMSNPNDMLCRWLFRVLDRNFSEDSFNRTPARNPYTYEDLSNIGVDSVMVTKNNSDQFSISFCEVGTYEDFIEYFE